MSTELLMLFFSILLGLGQLLLATHFATLQRGVKWNLSSRDAKMPDLTGVAGRLDRAFKNFMETFPSFAAAVILVQVTQQGDGVSALGAWFYFVARLVYVPVYAFGLVGVRTAVWSFSLAGMALVLASVFV